MLLTARYVLPVTAPYIEDGAVLVRDDRIVEVGRRDDLMGRHPTEEVRDFGLAALLPGFVDLHTHLEYSIFRGLVDDLPYSEWKMSLLEKERRLTDEDWSTSATLGVLEAIQSGITTVADITSRGWRSASPACARSSTARSRRWTASRSPRWSRTLWRTWRHGASARRAIP
jgi:5-methylthioadenosine/S-adenosylhomocysteine deaminase